MKNNTSKNTIFTYCQNIYIYTIYIDISVYLNVYIYIYKSRIYTHISSDISTIHYHPMFSIQFGSPFWSLPPGGSLEGAAGTCPLTWVMMSRVFYLSQVLHIENIYINNSSLIYNYRIWIQTCYHEHMLTREIYSCIVHQQNCEDKQKYRK